MRVRGLGHGEDRGNVEHYAVGGLSVSRLRRAQNVLLREGRSLRLMGVGGLRDGEKVRLREHGLLGELRVLRSGSFELGIVRLMPVAQRPVLADQQLTNLRNLGLIVKS